MEVINEAINKTNGGGRILFKYIFKSEKNVVLGPVNGVSLEGKKIQRTIITMVMVCGERDMMTSLA